MGSKGMPPKDTLEDRIESLERAVSGEHGSNGIMRRLAGHDERLRTLENWKGWAAAFASGIVLACVVVRVMLELWPQLFGK